MSRGSPPRQDHYRVPDQVITASPTPVVFPVLARRLAKGGALRETLAAYEGEQGGLRLIRAARDLDPRQTEHIGEAPRASGADERAPGAQPMIVSHRRSSAPGAQTQPLELATSERHVQEDEQWKTSRPDSRRR